MLFESFACSKLPPKGLTTIFVKVTNSFISSKQTFKTIVLHSSLTCQYCQQRFDFGLRYITALYKLSQRIRIRTKIQTQLRQQKIKHNEMQQNSLLEVRKTTVNKVTKPNLIFISNISVSILNSILKCKNHTYLHENMIILKCNFA